MGSAMTRGPVGPSTRGGANAAVVDAGEVAGKTEGDNPHLWYGPDFVSAVADAVTGELEDLAPDATPYFDEQATAWHSAMQPYYDEVAELGAVVAGSVTYGATEPVFDLHGTSARLGRPDAEGLRPGRGEWRRSGSR